MSEYYKEALSTLERQEENSHLSNRGICWCVL
jgi:hypothetical protein